jgi:lysozyme family protein
MAKKPTAAAAAPAPAFEFTPSEFGPAYDFTSRWEGGFANNPADPGGITNFGITLPFLKGVAQKDLLDADLNDDGRVDAGDITDMTHEEAAALYQKYVWDALKLAEVAPQPIATKCFDLLVNLRPSTAAHIMQLACNAIQPGILVEDNQFGPKTRAALTQLGLADPRRMMDMLRTFHKAFYVRRVQNDPTQHVFYEGWIARAGG